MLSVSQSEFTFEKHLFITKMCRCFVTLKFNPGDENFVSKETKLQLE